MITEDQQYRFRKSFNGKLILQVLVEAPADVFHGGIFDERRILKWVDADEVDGVTAMYILNKDGRYDTRHTKI